MCCSPGREPARGPQRWFTHSRLGASQGGTEDDIIRIKDVSTGYLDYVGRTRIHSAFWPEHRLSPDLPLPGHGGNFTLSGIECSTPQHSERYRPWTWLISPGLCMTALLVDKVTSAWPRADIRSSRRQLVAESPSAPVQLSAGLVGSS